MVMTGFLEEKPKREIQLFCEEIRQDCMWPTSKETCFPGGLQEINSALHLLRSV